MSKGLSRFCSSDKLPWTIILVGIVLRFVRYMYNSSLWFDEVRYALGIVSEDFDGYIPAAINYSITSPVGFFEIERIAVMLFGNTEYALRLFPFLCGVISLFLFYKVARSFLNPGAGLIALGLFAILDPMVIFSSELKPYMSDITAVLLIYMVAIGTNSKNLTTSRFLMLLLLSAAVWISHPSVLVLAGVGITMFLSDLMNKNWTRLNKLVLIYMIWAVSFLAIYFAFTDPIMQNLSGTTNNDVFWIKKQAFMPFPPKSLSDVKWFVDILFRTLENPLGITLTGVSAFTLSLIHI